MRKLLFITFICSSLCAYAQSEIPEDTIKNRPPVKKEQIPFSPKENKRTGLDESQPQQSLQGEQQEEINLHLPPSDYPGKSLVCTERIKLDLCTVFRFHLYPS